MKTRLLKLLPLAALLLGSTTVTRADATVTDAIGKLREAQNYSWTKTTETPGAPFSVPPVSGKAIKDGFALHETKSDGKPLQAVTKGNRGVVKVGSEWKSTTELTDAKGRPSADVVELAGARAPADELNGLASNLDSAKQDADGSWSGKLDAEVAKLIMSNQFRHRAPMPNMEISRASGSIRLWVRDGVPQKYVVTISGAVSLPFGEREMTRTTTVTISEVGSTAVEIPAEAKAKLEPAAP